MPYKEPDDVKMFYSIGEVSRLLNVNQSLLRFWEKEFDILKPQKTQKGNRQFTKKDVDNLKLIYHLVKEKGFTLEGARKKLKEKNTEQLDTTAELHNSLKKVRGFLVELKEMV